MWQGKKISIIIPALNEEETIRSVVDEIYKETPADELIVIDNGSTDRTKEEVGKTKAKIIEELKRGYGNALRRGLKEASGDFIVLFDADGNFPAKDIMKLLPYADEFDFVKGTRARKELVEKGIYSPLVSWLVIIANIAVSKFQQFLFRGPALTDAGCTLRLINKKTRDTILPYLTVGGGHFLTDMTNLAMIAKLKIIEVPVRFTKRRGGKSKHGGFWGLSKIAARMVAHTIKQRLLAWLGYYKFATGIKQSSLPK